MPDVWGDVLPVEVLQCVEIGYDADDNELVYFVISVRRSDDQHVLVTMRRRIESAERSCMLAEAKTARAVMASMFRAIANHVEESVMPEEDL